MDTATGTLLLVVELFPSSPSLLSPQQNAFPVTSRHACTVPVETDVLAGHGVTTFVPAGELPPAVTATTDTVYDVPFVNPVSSHDSAAVVVHVAVPGDADTEYPVTGPGVPVDADQYTVAVPFPGNAATLPGAVAFSATVTGTRLCVVELFPSWPLLFCPQQYAAPAEAIAHVEVPRPLAESWVTTAPDSTPDAETATGTLLCVVELLPS